MTRSTGATRMVQLSTSVVMPRGKGAGTHVVKCNYKKTTGDSCCRHVQFLFNHGSMHICGKSKIKEISFVYRCFTSVHVNPYDKMQLIASLQLHVLLCDNITVKTVKKSRWQLSLVVLVDEFFCGVAQPKISRTVFVITASDINLFSKKLFTDILNLQLSDQ